MGAKLAGYSLNPISKNLFQSAKLNKIFVKDYRKNIQIIIVSINVLKNLDQKLSSFSSPASGIESFNNPYDTILTNVVGMANLLEIVKNKFVKSVW